MAEQPVTRIWPVELWSRNDVSVWLSTVALRKYAEIFRRHDICGRSLMLLDERNLVDMNITSLGDRKALLFEINRLEKWTGMLWRTDIETTNGVITLELLLSLSPNKMTAICAIQQAGAPPDKQPNFPEIRIKWLFTQERKDEYDTQPAGKFSTIAVYEPSQFHSIIRLPCPVSDAEVMILPPDGLDERF